MSTSSKIPTYLFQVLEAEYIALYRESPHESTPLTFDPDTETERQVVPTFDWSFDKSHISDPKKFIEELKLTSTPTVVVTPVSPPALGFFTRLKTGVIRFGKKVVVTARRVFDRPNPPKIEDPDKIAKEKLTSYLREQLTKKSLGRDLVSDPATIAAALNTFLTDTHFFSEERFSVYWLDSITKGMRDIHQSRPRVGRPQEVSGPLEGDDLAHFNRLLFEAAFHDCLEKIHRIRLAAIYQRIHEKRPAALCLSGGGIRSGTFALGLLQGFARHKLLDKFNYLSTVSGGGYMGSWLAAWIHRHPFGLKGVTADLAHGSPETKVDPDAEPIRYLRRYSNFITPKVGALSADTWTFIGIYLRNLILNWMVFIPLLLGVLMLPRMLVAITIAPSGEQHSLDLIPGSGSFPFPGRYWFLIVGLLLTIWSISYIMFNRPTVREELRQASPVWRRRSTQRYFLRWCLLPLATAAFCLTTYWIWSVQSEALPKSFAALVGFGAVTTSGAWVVSSWVLGRLRSVRAIVRLGIGRIFTRDLVSLLLSGIGGGLVLYLMTKLFDAFAPKVVDFSSAATAWNWKAWTLEVYACFAAPAFMLVFLLGATLFIGITSRNPRVNDEDREWWSRLSAWVLIVILGWSIFNVLVIFGPVALLSAPTILSSFGGISGVVAALIGRSSKTPGGEKSKNGAAQPSILDAVMAKVLPLLALVFLVFLLVILSLATSGILAASAYLPPMLSAFFDNGDIVKYWFERFSFNVSGELFWSQLKLAHMNLLHLTPFWFATLVFLILVGAGFYLSKKVNLNIFSLHGGYRNRLIRAFLGASRPDNQRKPNPFTGFDPSDNISMHELRTGLFDEDDFIRPVELAQELLNHKNGSAVNGKQGTARVIDYLAKSGNLKTLESVPNHHDYSSRLVAALRTDLNHALQDPNLFACLTKQPTTEEEKKKAEKKAAWRMTNQISLNRKILQKTFPRHIKRKELDEPYRLLPIINTTLNLVGGNNLAWQQRKAEPFSVSPLYSGCFRLGYRDSRDYGGRNTGGISIGTAAAISGAAASSNMGYYTTSPLLSLVLTFFNVRLGWWLGNPGLAGNETFHQHCPTSSVSPVLEEALGMTDDENAYVYLTDGGHFENLGFYEMVLRRCHTIVVSDAAADGDYRFGDLGNAIRKVRIDLGIPIEFTAMPIFRCDLGEKKKGMYWAVGRIRYSCIDGKGVKDGLLLYIKPAIYGDEPGDVLEYRKNNPAFPHQSTADQFFDEPQFESYRALGSYVMQQMCGLDPKEKFDLEEAVSNAVEKLLDCRDGAPADPQLKDWWEKWRQPTSNPVALSWLIS